MTSRTILTHCTECNTIRICYRNHEFPVCTRCIIAIHDDLNRVERILDTNPCLTYHTDRGIYHTSLPTCTECNPLTTQACSPPDPGCQHHPLCIDAGYQEFNESTERYYADMTTVRHQEICRCSICNLPDSIVH